jgi:NAD(P)-dependent dehydrogenase (short-subunit alcohol dehydrogenase family)
MTQKTVLITGASSGIGRAIAQSLAKEGYRVFATARTPDTVNEIVGVNFVPLDVRSDESVAECVKKVVDQAGRIDILVNNAGSALDGALEETSIDEARALFETNFFGVLRVTKAVLAVMRGNGGGRVVTIGSVLGFLPMPYQGIYAATKHALEGWSETLDYEVRRLGIRAVLIEPTFIRTAIEKNTARAATQLEAYAAGRRRAVELMRKEIAGGDSPEAVAKVVLRALQSRNPKLRYRAGRGAELTRAMRVYLPEKVFDFGLRRRFGLGTAS